MPIETWFPLAIYYADLDDACRRKHELVQIIESMRETAQPHHRLAENTAWTGDVQGIQQIHSDGRFAWLTREVELHCYRYLAALGYRLDRISLHFQRSWPVVTDTKQFVATHRHLSSHISVVYFVQAPEGCAKLNFFNAHAPNEVADGLQAREGEIIETNHLTWPMVRYTATEGRLMVFPSKVPHAVPASDVEGLRISISYDIVMTIRSEECQPRYEFLMPSPHTWRQFGPPPPTDESEPRGASVGHEYRSVADDAHTIAEVAQLAAQFEARGFVALGQVLSDDECVDLDRMVSAELERRMTAGGPFGDIHHPQNRFDIPLKAEGVALEAVRACCTHPLLGPLLTRLMGEQATLEEVSVLMSFPGASAQPWHCDAEGDAGTARLLTVLLALVEVDEHMGALEVAPGTNFGGSSESIRGSLPLPRGAVVVMDATLHHRGGANVKSRRPLFYFSLMGAERQRPSGPIFSMLGRTETTIRLIDLSVVGSARTGINSASHCKPQAVDTIDG